MGFRAAFFIVFAMLAGLDCSSGGARAQTVPAGTTETTDELVARAQRAKRAPCDRAAYQAVLDRLREELANAERNVRDQEQEIANTLKEIEDMESRGVVVGPLLSSLRGASSPKDASSIAERAAYRAARAAKQGYGGEAQSALIGPLAKLAVAYEFLSYWQEARSKRQRAIARIEAAPWQCGPEAKQPVGTTGQPSQGQPATPTTPGGQGSGTPAPSGAAPARAEPAIPPVPSLGAPTTSWANDAEHAADQIFERAKKAKQECRKEDYEIERAKLRDALRDLMPKMVDAADDITDDMDYIKGQLQDLDATRTANLRQDLADNENYQQDLADLHRAYEGFKAANKAGLGGPNGPELELLLKDLTTHLEQFKAWYNAATDLRRHIMRLLDQLNRLPMACPPQQEAPGPSTAPLVPGGGAGGTTGTAPAPGGAVTPVPGAAEPPKAPPAGAPQAPKPMGETGYVPGMGTAETAQYATTLSNGVTLTVSPVIARTSLSELGFGTVIPPGALFGEEPFATRSSEHVNIYGGFGSIGIPFDCDLPWGWGRPRLNLMGGAASGSEDTSSAIRNQNVALTYQTMFPGSTGLFVGMNDLFIDTRTQVDTYKVGGNIESTLPLGEQFAWNKSIGFYFARFEQDVTADFDLPNLFGAPGFSIDGRSRNDLSTNYYLLNFNDRLVYTPTPELTLYVSGSLGLGYFRSRYDLSERIHCVPCAGGPEENTRFTAHQDTGGFTWDGGLGLGAIYRPAPNVSIQAGLDFLYVDKVADGERRANPARDPVGLDTRHMWTRAITLGMRVSF